MHMHPEITMTLARQHREEMIRHAAHSRRPADRRFPRWHLSWPRLVSPTALRPSRQPNPTTTD